VESVTGTICKTIIALAWIGLVARLFGGPLVVVVKESPETKSE
jgi:hypothetical protein